MKSLILTGGVAVVLCLVLAQEPELDSPDPLSGSSLAGERNERTEFSADVEVILTAIESQAADGGAFHLLADWQVDLGFPLDLNRDGLGLASYKTAMNWQAPQPDPGYWQSAQLKAVGKDGELRISRLDETGQEVEWWHVREDYLYASRMFEVLPFVTRWRAVEAFESGMLGYAEGLGLILWTFRPGQFLRRAEHLEVGEPVTIGNRQFLTLVQLPGWINEPPTLPTRHYHPTNETKLRSWAEHYPAVVYFIDPVTYVIEGAAFDYYAVTRSHAGRWTVGAQARGHALESWVREWGTTANGGRMPARVEATYTVDDQVVRRTVWAIRDEQLSSGTVTPLQALEIEPGRRVYEPWPPYQSLVYRQRIEAGASDYANRVGLVDALAFEGDLALALVELKQLVSDFQNDQTLVPESTGGIDWHLGYAVYEFLQHEDTPEYQEIWNGFAATEPYASILARAVDFYARWRRDTHVPLVEQHFGLYERLFGAKARLLHVIQRPLAPRVETEADRALVLDRVMQAAENDDLRLQAIERAVESYLSVKDYDAALDLIARGRALLVSQDHLTRLAELEVDWNERISAEIDARYKARLAAEILAKEDLLSQLQLRLQKARQFGTAGEQARLDSLRRETENTLIGLRQQ